MSPQEIGQFDTVYRRNVPCRACAGSGVSLNSHPGDPETCKRCSGSGRLNQTVTVTYTQVADGKRKPKKTSG